MIPLIAAPILGRLYTPNEYGVLALFMSIATVLGGVGNWQFSQAIVVVKEDRDAHVLLRLCAATSVVTSIVVLAGVLIFLSLNSLSHSSSSMGLWFLWLPAVVLGAGVTTSLVAVMNRRSDFRLIATVQVLSVLGAVVVSVSLGIRGLGYVGLLCGYIAGQAVSIALYSVSHYRKGALSTIKVTKSRLLTKAARHRDFALFTTPSEFVSNFTMQLPVYVLMAAGDLGLIGLFNRARQLLSLPVSLVVGSVSQVFQRQAALDYGEFGSCRNLYSRTVVLLALIGAGPMAFLMVYAEQLFIWFLGPDWGDAGMVARILAPMLYLRMICSPVSTVFYVVGAQKEDFYLTFFTTVLAIVAMGYVVFGQLESVFVIVAFATAYTFKYVLYLIRGFFISHDHQVA